MKTFTKILVSMLILSVIILDYVLVDSYISTLNVNSAINHVQLGVIITLLVVASWLPIYGLIADLKD